MYKKLWFYFELHIYEAREKQQPVVWSKLAQLRIRRRGVQNKVTTVKVLQTRDVNLPAASAGIISKVRSVEIIIE